MGQIMYRVYRTSTDDPFGAPCGWLAKHGGSQMWVPSDVLSFRDVYSLGQAQILCDDWNDYWSSKGASYRAEYEKAD